MPGKYHGISRSLMPAFIAFILVHVACFGAIWSGITGSALLLMGLSFLIRMFGVTAGYHRYFSHRTFQTSRAFQFILAFVAQTSLQSGAVWWAAKHRAHHRYSDLEQDSHSPVQHGFWFSHVGWIFNEDAARADYSRVPDLTRYPELMWLDRHRFFPGVVLGLLSFAIAGWSGLFVGFFWSTVLLYHATFSINSLAHVLGRPRYLTGDESKNNVWLALITLGEGWHNNHHYYMASARQGFHWWEVDFTYYGLRLLGLCGIVHDIKEPPAHILNGQRGIAEPMMDRIAQRVASTFCADSISKKVHEKLAMLATTAADARAAAMAELVKAEMPTLDDIRKKAARMFARTDALAEVVERARRFLIQAVNQRLNAQLA